MNITSYGIKAQVFSQPLTKYTNFGVPQVEWNYLNPNLTLVNNGAGDISIQSTQPIKEATLTLNSAGSVYAEKIVTLRAQLNGLGSVYAESVNHRDVQQNGSRMRN